VKVKAVKARPKGEAGPEGTRKKMEIGNTGHLETRNLEVID
jgi:hypothetical protein